MENAFEFIFKLTAGVPQVLKWFTTNKEKWAWMVEWATTVNYPVSTLEQNNNVRLKKKRTNFQQYPQQLKNEAFKNSFL